MNPGPLTLRMRQIYNIEDSKISMEKTVKIRIEQPKPKGPLTERMEKILGGEEKEEQKVSIVESKLDLIKELGKFLTDDFCVFSPSETVKGTFFYKEFCLFLEKNNINGIPEIRAFYNLIEDWMINQKDELKRVTRHNYSGVVYFKGVSVKNKYDDAKDELDKRKREQGKKMRREKAI